MAKFKVGETYTARSAANHEVVWEFTVLKRTAKFITIESGNGRETKRVGVKTDADGDEWALPLGSYSMAPVIRASRPKEAA